MLSATLSFLKFFLHGALVVACTWNCILPGALYACCCTGDVHVQAAGEGCPKCAKEQQQVISNANCCAAHSAREKSCCEGNQSSLPANGAGRNTQSPCSSDCCVDLAAIKTVAVLGITGEQDQSASQAALLEPAYHLPRPTDVVAVLPAAEPPQRVSLQILYCVWRN